MLSLSSISEAQGTSYWEKEDYYFNNNKQEVISGKEQYGLGDTIDFERFNQIVQERIDETGGNKRGNNKIAEDLTFSASKSVSIVAAFDKENREKIFEAHRDAVQKTIDFIKENNMIQTRISVDGEKFAKSGTNWTGNPILTGHRIRK